MAHNRETALSLIHLYVHNLLQTTLVSYLMFINIWKPWLLLEYESDIKPSWATDECWNSLLGHIGNSLLIWMLLFLVCICVFSEAQGHENPVFLGGSPQVKTRTVSQIMTRQCSETGRHLLSEPGTPLSPPAHGDVFFPIEGRTHTHKAVHPDSTTAAHTTGHTIFRPRQRN